MIKIKTDFSELKNLADKIESSVKNNPTQNKGFNTDKLLKSGAKVVMESVLRTTPIGEDGSNWWDHDTKSYYPLGAKEHREGTLRRGWVFSPTYPGFTEHGGDATSQQMVMRIERSTVTHSGNISSIFIVNSTPYASDVEYGHNVVIGKSNVVSGYVEGQYYTRDGIGNSKKKTRQTVRHDLKKQMERVFKI